MRMAGVLAQHGTELMCSWRGCFVPSEWKGPTCSGRLACGWLGTERRLLRLAQSPAAPPPLPAHSP
jgi:hypothetical protein